VKNDWMILKTKHQMYFNSIVQSLPDLFLVIDDLLLSMMQVASIVASPLSNPLSTPSKAPLKKEVDVEVAEVEGDGVEQAETQEQQEQEQQKQQYESLPGYQMVLQKLQELKSKKWEHVMNYSMYITLSKADKKTLQPLYVKLSTLLLTHGSIIYECTLQEVEKEETAGEERTSTQGAPEATRST
jgi:hypothetical protein